jgi:hypothetical protein
LIFFSSPLFDLVRRESDERHFEQFRMADEKSGSGNEE